MEQLGTTLDHPTTEAADPDFTIAPMGPIRRTREAARIAWTVLRTGRHIEAEALMNGADAGMDVGSGIATAAFTRVLTRPAVTS